MFLRPNAIHFVNKSAAENLLLQDLIKSKEFFKEFFSKIHAVMEVLSAHKLSLRS